MGKDTNTKNYNVPPKLLKQWEFVMNTIWNFLNGINTVGANLNLSKDEAKIYVKFPNDVSIEIALYFYNHRYLQLQISMPKNEDFKVELSHIDKYGEKGITTTISVILTYIQKI